jgi:hypothetical protein
MLVKIGKGFEVEIKLGSLLTGSLYVKVGNWDGFYCRDGWPSH